MHSPFLRTCLFLSLFLLNTLLEKFPLLLISFSFFCRSVKFIFCLIQFLLQLVKISPYIRRFVFYCISLLLPCQFLLTLFLVKLSFLLLQIPECAIKLQFLIACCIKISRMISKLNGKRLFCLCFRLSNGNCAFIERFLHPV